MVTIKTDTMHSEVFDLYHTILLSRDLTATDWEDKLARVVDTIMETWEKEKGWLFPYFGPEGRITQEVDLLDFTISDFMEIWNTDGVNSVPEKPQYRELSPHMREAVFSNFKSLCRFIIERDSSAFVENKLTEKLIGSVRFTEDQFTKLSPGMRLTKAFRAWTDHWLRRKYIRYNSRLPSVMDLEMSQKAMNHQQGLLTDLVNTLYSVCLTGRKESTGIVTLSIRPIDLLLQSTHTSGGWRSCHAVEDGEYRTAGMAMSMDAHTAIATLHTYSEELRLRNRDTGVYEYVGFPAPQKRWRSLFHLHPDGIALIGRHYPAPHLVPLEVAKRMAMTALAAHKNMKPLWKKRKNPARHDYLSLRTSKWAYMDSPTERLRLRPTISETTEEQEDSSSVQAEFILWPRALCLRCGGPLGYSGSHLCHSCVNEGKTKCAHCRSWFATDTMYPDTHVGDGEHDRWYCDRCYHEVFQECDECLEFKHVEYTRFYNTADDHRICEECANALGLTPCEYCRLLCTPEDLIEVCQGSEHLCTGCVENAKQILGPNSIPFPYGECTGCGDIEYRPIIANVWKGDTIVRECYCDTCYRDMLTSCDICDSHRRVDDPVHENVGGCPNCRADQYTAFLGNYSNHEGTTGYDLPTATTRGTAEALNRPEYGDPYPPEYGTIYHIRQSPSLNTPREEH